MASIQVLHDSTNVLLDLFALEPLQAFMVITRDSTNVRNSHDVGAANKEGVSFNPGSLRRAKSADGQDLPLVFHDAVSSTARLYRPLNRVCSQATTSTSRKCRSMRDE